MKKLLTCYMAMLYYIHMARGDSGRIVLEINPSDKEELYSALIQEKMTLKDWFLKQAANYLQHRSQMKLFEATTISESLPSYRKINLTTNKDAGSRKKKAKKRK